MARAIQPFSTFADGDTLFAATTDQVPASAMSAIDLDTMAGEIMWDAILASVPQEPAPVMPSPVAVSEERLPPTRGFTNSDRMRVSKSPRTTAHCPLPH
jgi:hypothetical protein